MLRAGKAHANWQPRGGGDSPASYISQYNQALKSGDPAAGGSICARPYEVKVAIEKAHETGLAGRYANAVFELAEEQGLVDVVAADFAAIKATMTQSADFTRLIKSPLFSHEDQARALKPVLEN